MATTKKRSSPRKTIKSKSTKSLKSFKLSKETIPFSSFRITEQTIYWSILLVYVLVLALWILNIQLETLKIIDGINT